MLLRQATVGDTRSEARALSPLELFWNDIGSSWDVQVAQNKHQLTKVTHEALQRGTLEGTTGQSTFVAGLLLIFDDGCCWLL